MKPAAQPHRLGPVTDVTVGLGEVCYKLALDLIHGSEQSFDGTRIESSTTLIAGAQ